jgi:hypothetical protein
MKTPSPLAGMCLLIVLIGVATKTEVALVKVVGQQVRNDSCRVLLD